MAPPREIPSGEYNQTFNISDGVNAVLVNLTVKVDNQNHAPTFVASLSPQSVRVGNELIYPLPAEYDQDGDSITASVQLANSTALPSWITFQSTASPKTLTFKPLSGNQGTYIVEITLTDGMTPSTQAFDLEVANQPPYFETSVIS